MSAVIEPEVPDNVKDLGENESNQDSLLAAVRWLCAYHGKIHSDAALLAGMPRDALLTPTLAVRVLDQVGIGSGWVRRPLNELQAYLFPLALLRKDGGALLLLGREGEGADTTYQVVVPETDGGAEQVAAQMLEEHFAGHALLAKPKPRLDDRAGEALTASKGHWLVATLWRYRRYYYSAALAALLVNVLTLASTFFTMNVYDRVIPHEAYATLWSLAVGVVLAMTFEFTARTVRTHVVDIAGKKADLILGAVLFRKLLATRMEHKPQSAGASANQLREFESVRDFATSATVSTLSDLPFTLFFVGVIAMIGGRLALVPAMAIPVIIIISVAVQWPLAKVMKEAMREGSLKQGLLIESIEGIETLKATRGEGVMQRKWDAFSALSAASAMRSRSLSALAANSVTLIQQIQTVVLVVWGVYLIHGGDLTMGALFGVVILSGRATAPLASLVGLAVRFQQARVALRSLDQVMASPVDRDSERRYLAKPAFDGHITLKNIHFNYPAPPMQQAPNVLQGIHLTIKPGERVGILGNIGCGKSSLLRLMGALYQPTQGQVLMDGIDVAQIDPADLRAAVGVLSQEPRLFHGTLHDNVIIGKPEASSAEFLQVARLCGLDAIAARHPRGFDMPIGEGGQGLSGGQRQLVALARCLLLRPSILLMDEPTSSMDMMTERYFLGRMAAATRGQTLVVATHRLSVLELVDRIVVLDIEGKVFKDGPKQQVLAELTRKAVPDERAQKGSVGHE